VAPTVLHANWLIDGRSAEAIPDGAVVTDGERIAWAGAAADLPAGLADEGTVLRFPGCSLLPGFVDAHTHFTLFADGRPYQDMAAESDGIMLLAGVRNAWAHLSAGVTTARDNGSRRRNGFVLREAISRGIIAGPRLLVAGPPVTPTGGHFHWCDGTADGEDGLRRQVRSLIGQGADHVKIMASGGGTIGTDPGRPCYTTAELRAAIATSHDLGRLTTAHCRASEAMRRATDAEVDCIEHGEFIDPDGVMRFDESIARLMAEHGTYLSPTLQASGWDTILRCRQLREVRELTDQEARELSVAEQETEQRLEQIGKLVDLGLGDRIIAGTDAGCFDFSFGHIDYAMKLMVAGGMSPMAAIMAATSVAARALGLDDQIGSLEAGKIADVAIVRGDPLADIDRTGEIESVFQRGTQVLDPLGPARPLGLLSPVVLSGLTGKRADSARAMVT
jgi:imidazolonepropionase-like amidohydrolase